MVLEATKHPELSEREQSSKACFKVMAPLLQRLLLPHQNTVIAKSNLTEQ
jgi:hypothetical protein